MNDIRILIASDEPDFHLIIKQYLIDKTKFKIKSTSFNGKKKTPRLEIESVNTVRAALEKLRTDSVEILVLDFDMTFNPGEGKAGLEFIAEIRKLDKNCAVIAVTAYMNLGAARKLLHLGVFDFIEKPMNLATLVGAVQRAIDLQYREPKKIKGYGESIQPPHLNGDRDLDQYALIEKTSKSEYLDKPRKQTLSYALKQLRVRNFYGIIDTYVSRLPVDASWIFLTGENSYGKTSILQALAVGLFGGRDGDKILADSTAKIAAEYFDHGESRVNNLWHPSFKPFPVFAAYGSSRLEIQSRQSENEISQKSAKTYGLFESDGILLNIEYQLLIWYLDKDPKYEVVKNTLSKVLPFIADIKIIDKEVLYVEKEMGEDGRTYDPLPFKKLASGSRSIIAMVGDMLIRLLKEQPEITDPKDLAGIVIIDELDLHLHPRWQRELPSLLSNVFPKVQFIVSTHSVIPFLGAPEASVFLKVTRNIEEGIQLRRIDIDIRHLLPNSILTSPIFDLEGDEITQVNKGDILDVRTEDDYKKKVKNDKIKENLDAFERGDKDFPDDLFDQD